MALAWFWMKLGFGVPYFDTFVGTCYLEGAMKKSILFSPWLLQTPGKGFAPDEILVPF